LYKRCNDEPMFILLAQLLPAHIKCTKVVPCIIMAQIATPELICTCNVFYNNYICFKGYHRGVLRWVYVLYYTKMFLDSNTTEYKCGRG
jgi:hypothetical protein